MWQPWNGLEIWSPDSWDFSDNSKEFEGQVPPKDCFKKWYKPTTIKCTEAGYPETSNST